MFGGYEINMYLCSEFQTNSKGTDFTGTQKDKRVKEQTRREQLSKYLYDVSKVFIAGMFIINILPIVQGDATIQDIIMSVMGALASIGFAWAANRIIIY